MHAIPSELSTGPAADLVDGRRDAADDDSDCAAEGSSLDLEQLFRSLGHAVPAMAIGLSLEAWSMLQRAGRTLDAALFAAPDPNDQPVA